MGEEQASPTGRKFDLAIIAGFALLKFLIHVAVNSFGGYGYFRDELYYLACSEHIDLGYVDQPPLSIYLLAVTRYLIGDSLVALRLLPAVAGAATVFLTGLMARELGGRRFSVALACIAATVSLIALGMDSVYSMNAIDFLLWAAAGYTVIRLVRTGDPRYWLILGVVIGLGLFNKTSVFWLASGLFAGLLLTPLRAWLKTVWPWAAALIAFLVFAPYIVWNVTHDMAHLEFIRNATAGKYSMLTPAAFLLGQLLLQNPLSLPLWLAGVILFLFVREWREYRVLGFMYLIPLIILTLNQHSKSEYLAPAYSTLFAGGAVGVERLLQPERWRWARVAYSAVLVLSGCLLAPLVVPVLPVETYIRYAGMLGVKPSTSEAKSLDKLPQFYADMFGWEDKAAAVGRAYHALSDEDQKRCAIFADNYGRCAAIDFFGGKYGLPKSIGKHNSYWIWGPRGYTGELVMILGGGLKDKQELFDSVAIAGIASCSYCMPYENNLPIYVCRTLKIPLAVAWPGIKTYE